MSETVNQGSNVNNAAETGKTFTQSEMEAIIETRIGKERAKYGDYEDLKAKAAKYDEMEAASKTELQKATEKVTALQDELKSIKKQNEVRGIREEVAKANGIPANLLTAETREECEAQAKSLLEFAGSQKGYPVVRDGGETNKSVKLSTNQQFAEWFNQHL